KTKEDTETTEKAVSPFHPTPPWFPPPRLLEFPHVGLLPSGDPETTRRRSGAPRTLERRSHSLPVSRIPMGRDRGAAARGMADHPSPQRKHRRRVALRQAISFRAAHRRARNPALDPVGAVSFARQTVRNQANRRRRRRSNAEHGPRGRSNGNQRD